MYHLVRDQLVDRAAGSNRARAGLNEISAVVHRHFKWCAPLLILPVLAACGGDDHHGHNGGGAQVAQQVTLGLVAANFLSTDQTGPMQILGTSTVQQAVAGNPSNLQFFFPVTGAQSMTFPDGNDPLYLAAGDLNGDGLPDVVSASGVDGTLSVFLNTPGNPGTFGLPITLPSQGASQVAIMNMSTNGSGALPALVAADFNVSLFLQSSPGNFAAPIALSPATTSSSGASGGANWVAVGNLNADNLPDVALTDFSGLKVVFNTSTASATSFAAPVSVYNFASPGQFQVVAVADVNGDNLADLIVTDQTTSNHTVQVLLQDSSNRGSFLTPVAYPIQSGNGVTSILVKDVNNDNRPDILVASAGGVSVLLQDPATRGTFQTAAVYNAPFANEIALVDVDGDGRLDIVVGTGPTQPVMNFIQPNAPGVLLQSATTPGTFGMLQALPGTPATTGTGSPAPGM